MKILKIFSIIIAVLIVVVLGAASYVKLALPDVGAAPEIKVEVSPERIERGKYLAHSVMLCADCHSTRDWSVYAGPMKPEGLGGGGEHFGREMGFPGDFYSPNITPYALSTWSDGELFRAITTGVSKNGRALFPLMPYQRFGTMDKEDIYDVIAYIRSLEPVQSSVPASSTDFPVNFLINTMPQKASFTTKPSLADEKYGAYIINAAGCVDCHSKTEKGKIIPGTEFGGGMEFVQPGGIVRSANITPDKQTGIGQWTEEMFVNRFKAYTDSNYQQQKLAPGDLNTPMPWVMYGSMKEADLKAIYRYLSALRPIANTVVKMEKKN